MKSVLLLMTAATYRAAAFLDAARRVGVEVVIGTDRPQATAGLNPAGHLALDFDDPQRSLPLIASHAARHPLAAVIATEDEGVLLAARAAAVLGLRHAAPEAVRACRDKLGMRRALRSAGHRSPWFEGFDPGADPVRIANQVPYPCVIKPTFLSGSRGVLRADDPEQFATAFETVRALLARPEVAIRSEGPAEILVEEYLPGAEVALEGLLEGGRLRVLALFDKPDPLIGPTFEETIYVTPSRHPPAIRERVERETGSVAKALGLAEGPVHAELRIDGDDARIIEIAPRTIGGLCSRALRFGEGVSLEELILRRALDLGGERLEREPAASGVMMIPIPGAGVLKSVRGLSEAQGVSGIEEIRITVPVGQELKPLPEGATYLGFLFARAERPEAVEAALRAAHRKLEIDVQPSTAPARP